MLFWVKVSNTFPLRAIYLSGVTHDSCLVITLMRYFMHMSIIRAFILGCQSSGPRIWCEWKEGLHEFILHMTSAILQPHTHSGDHL